MLNENIFQFILEQLEIGCEVALCVVAQSNGSSPGKKGFKLVQSSSGAVMGTIGGGIMEKNIRDQLFSNDSLKTKILHLDHNVKTLNNIPSGLVCSGQQTVIILHLNAQDLSIIKNIVESKQSFVINKLGLCNANVQSSPITYIDGEHWEYRENIQTSKKLFIFGGGHVGLAISKIASMLDFNITVIDDRQNIETLQQNKFAQKIIVAPYDQLNEYLQQVDGAFAVIVTKSMMDDAMCLQAVIDKPFAFIGVMGSQSKITHIKQQLQRKHIDLQLFDRVQAPIGLPIGAKTAEEIAVSICAQLIQVGNFK